MRSERVTKQNYKEEDRHETNSFHVVWLNQLSEIGAVVVTPECLYRGTQSEHSPWIPAKSMGMTDFGKVRILRSKLRGIQPT